MQNTKLNCHRIVKVMLKKSRTYLHFGEFRIFKNGLCLIAMHATPNITNSKNNITTILVDVCKSLTNSALLPNIEITIKL